MCCLVCPSHIHYGQPASIPVPCLPPTTIETQPYTHHQLILVLGPLYTHLTNSKTFVRRSTAHLHNLHEYLWRIYANTDDIARVLTIHVTKFEACYMRCTNMYYVYNVLKQITEWKKWDTNEQQLYEQTMRRRRLFINSFCISFMDGCIEPCLVVCKCVCIIYRKLRSLTNIPFQPFFGTWTCAM